MLGVGLGLAGVKAPRVSRTYLLDLEDFTGYTLLANATLAVDTRPDPAGGTTADALRETTADGGHVIRFSPNPQIKTYTIELICKPVTNNGLIITFAYGAETHGLTCNLSTKEAQSASNLSSYSISDPDGNGFVTVQITFNWGQAVSGASLEIWTGINHLAFAYAGVATNGLDLATLRMWY